MNAVMTRFPRFAKEARATETRKTRTETPITRGADGRLGAMTTTPALHVERVLPARADLTVGEVDAILEAAYLATAADGRLSPEEHDSFRVVASALRQIAAGGGRARGRAKPIAESDLEALLARYGARSDDAPRPARIAAMRERLGRAPVRELAYKVAFAMALCDLEASDDEADYDDELIAAFGLDEARADALAAEVYAALDADLDRDSEAPSP